MTFAAELSAPIFNIVHGSFVDGYGVRTTVFLKGCPLRCTWCCNPESQKIKPELKVSAKRCTDCGNCEPVCEPAAISISAGGVRVDRDLCTNCGKCVDVCYTGALEQFGQYRTVGEVFEIVKRDEHFFRSSGGGVTIAGGEATLHGAFTLQLIRMCREHYIHTALDTCGYVVSKDGLQALNEADLLLFDVKSVDPEKHRRMTGVALEPILKNLKEMDSRGKHIIVRIPVIPDYTDSEHDLRAIAELLAGMKSVKRVDLLPVHELGKIKYEQLGREYPLNLRPIPVARQARLKAMFEEYSLTVQIGG